MKKPATKTPEIAENCDEGLQEYLDEWIDAMLEVYGEILREWKEYKVIQPFPNAQTKFACNSCGKCCNFKDYWVWVYPSDLLKWLDLYRSSTQAEASKLIPLLLGILFPVEDLDESFGYGLPSQKIIVEKFEELINNPETSGIIQKTLSMILIQLRKLNPTFKDDSEFCIFYDADHANHCLIYNLRPLQCRCYPLDFSQFTKIFIPAELEQRYGAYPDDLNDLPECPPEAYTGNPKMGVMTSEKDQEIVLMEKSNYLASQVTQDLQEEDISEILIELYHKSILNLERDRIVIDKSTLPTNRPDPSKSFQGYNKKSTPSSRENKISPQHNIGGSKSATLQPNPKPHVTQFVEGKRPDPLQKKKRPSSKDP